jgi:hypothetical protein
MVSDLLAGGLAHIHHRQPRKLPAAHLAAQPLPRQQRGHRRPPSPAGSHTTAPAAPTPGTCVASTRLASTANHPTAARRLACGSSAQHCLAAPVGPGLPPSSTTRLLATRAGLQPLDDLDQPQQPLTSEYRRLPHLVGIHRRILHGGLSRVTSRSKANSAGPTSRSEATGPSAGTGRWSAARSASAGRPSSPSIPTGQHQPTPRPFRRPRGGRRRPVIQAEPAAGLSWPRALRAVQAWLIPWSVLARCWRSWSPAPPPRPLQRLLDAAAAGQPLHLYLPP